MARGQQEVKGGTRDPRRDHVRIPKEIVLIPEWAVAEFLADHERVPEKNRACKGARRVCQCARRCAAGHVLGTEWGPVGKPPEAVVGASLRTADLYRVNLEVKLLRTFGSVAFPNPTTPKIAPKRAGFVDELLTSS